MEHLNHATDFAEGGQNELPRYQPYQRSRQDPRSNSPQFLLSIWYATISRRFSLINSLCAPELNSLTDSGESLKYQQPTIACFIEFRAAFDSENHDVLQKLMSLDVAPVKLMQLIQ